MDNVLIGKMLARLAANADGLNMPIALTPDDVKALRIASSLMPSGNPYRYADAKRALTDALMDLAILAGDEVGPSDASWQDVAGTCAVNLRSLANMLDAARTGQNRISDGPIVFPSIND